MIKDKISAVKQLFQSRRLSYCLTFKKDNLAAQAVLRDLAKFCRANETTFTTDQRASDVLAGRREVWMRIQNYLNLSVEDLYELHHVKKGE